MSNRKITIRETVSRRVLAEAVEKDGVQLFEGAWYYEPEQVDMTHLAVSERTFICPYKGTCYWIDLESPELSARDVGFTYFDVNPGYEFIKDRIGFYYGRRPATEQEIEELETLEVSETLRILPRY